MTPPKAKPKAKPRPKKQPPGEIRAERDQRQFEHVATEVLAKVAERIAPPEPQGGELVVRLDNPDQDVYRVMDAYDEAQILDELEGRPSDKMVYSFNAGGKKVTGLSYSGVAESVRTLNARGLTQIRAAKDVPPRYEDVQEENEHGDVVTYVECEVYVEDAKAGSGWWGLARQPKFQVFKDKDRKPELDKFAKTKALSKAQRNGGLNLVPLAFREILIALALEQPQRVQLLRAGVPSTQETQLGAPLGDERAEALAGEIREAYARVKGLPGGVRAMPPGRFNAKLSRARATDHASMEELRDELLSLAEHLDAEASKEKAT